MTEDKDMIKSMTGFGRCEIQKESRKFTVECEPQISGCKYPDAEKAEFF